MSVEGKDGKRHFNQGIKDQQMALVWVQENIERFGGDKSKVGERVNTPKHKYANTQTLQECNTKTSKHTNTQTHK